MRATLSYSLPKEETEFTNAVHGGHYFRVMCDLDRWLKDKINSNDLSQEKMDAFEEVREKFLNSEVVM